MSDIMQDLIVLGAQPVADVAAKLRAMGEPEIADEFAPTGTAGQAPQLLGRRRKLLPWQPIEHQFGYVAPASQGDLAAVVHASQVQPQQELIGTRIVIKLNRLYVAKYPGAGEHRVLFSFAANNAQSAAHSEAVRFALHLRARDGQHAAVIGWPIFSGLSVGKGGIGFECTTVNVKSSEDEQFLSPLESTAFRLVFRPFRA